MQAIVECAPAHASSLNGMVLWALVDVNAYGWKQRTEYSIPA